METGSGEKLSTTDTMIKVSKGCLGDEELAAIREVFETGYFGHGPRVIQFEEALQQYLGAAHVVATNTGTSALHLALAALGIGAGDEVLVPSLTYVASFQAIRATGATPVPCEVEPETLRADLKDMERRITPRTRVLMPVHYAGNPCDMNTLLAMKERYRLRVVEDAAHAFGATYGGRKIGSFGDITCFSFDSIKNITCGEGGAIVCSDAALAELMRQERTLGMKRDSPATASWKERDWRFAVFTQGFRYHMSSINAAAGLVQLRKADAFIAQRREICRRYDQAFQDLPRIRSLRINYDHAAPHIYVVRVRDGGREALMQFLKNADIETGINYIPNHLHPYFRQEGVSLPETERAYGEILTLPLHCGLSNRDVEAVIGCVRKFFEERREV